MHYPLTLLILPTAAGTHGIPIIGLAEISTIVMGCNHIRIVHCCSASSACADCHKAVSTSCKKRSNSTLLGALPGMLAGAPVDPMPLTDPGKITGKVAGVVAGWNGSGKGEMRWQWGVRAGGTGW